MYRAEFVNVRQHHFDALRLGLESAVAQERVEPDQAAARPVQPVHLERQLGVRLVLQPLGNQEHDGALPEHAPAPQFVEGVQRGGDPGAAGPALRRGSARVTLVSLVPNRDTDTRLRASVMAWRKCRNRRVYSLIEPDISSSATIGAGLSMRAGLSVLVV